MTKAACQQPCAFPHRPERTVAVPDVLAVEKATCPALDWVAPVASRVALMNHAMAVFLSASRSLSTPSFCVGAKFTLEVIQRYFGHLRRLGKRSVLSSAHDIHRLGRLLHDAEAVVGDLRGCIGKRADL